jgi:serine phosphatase RsbU (regulator of sigma subunit)
MPRSHAPPVACSDMMLVTWKEFPLNAFSGDSLVRPGQYSEASFRPGLLMQDQKAARERAAADIRKALQEGEIARLRQSLAAMEEAAAARKEAVRGDLERRRLQQEVDLQVRNGGGTFDGAQAHSSRNRLPSFSRCSSSARCVYILPIVQCIVYC